MRVLVAEDEQRLAAMLGQVLTEAGHVPTLTHDGTEALAVARKGGFDVLLLDWAMPGLTGPDIVAALRAEGHVTPALMLTARTGINDRVAGLDAGADDYLAKPFEVEELLARLRALHRRASRTSLTAFRAGDLVVDEPARTVTRGGQAVELTTREFDILTLLARNAGKCVTRFQILDQVWDVATDLSSNVIDQHVKSLRDKVDKPFGRETIQTVRGSGYRLDPAGG